MKKAENSGARVGKKKKLTRITRIEMGRGGTHPYHEINAPGGAAIGPRVQENGNKKTRA
jgi:hypothetical protein